MTDILLAVGYFAVSFVGAAACLRYVDSPTGSGDDPRTAAFFWFLIWPVCIVIFAGIFAAMILGKAIRLLADHLP